jgi:ABC-type Fe3+-hydroxamate transport system substrate-binding protein
MSLNGSTYKAPQLASAPERVVSLVPCLTHSLIDLGLGDRLVGVTDYCLSPEEAGPGVARLGGTKTPDVETMIALEPDLVIANQEENSRRSVEALRAAGIAVWLTFPQSVDQALQLLWQMLRLFRSEEATDRIRTLEMAVDWALQAGAQREPVCVFCPIWQGQTEDDQLWWMTFNKYTYCHDLLALLGGRNPFGERSRRYPLAADLGRGEAEDPGDRDTRYPCVTPEEVKKNAPEVVLLPSEPYEFRPQDIERLKTLLEHTPAVQHDCVYPIDGTLLTWHGTRIVRALAELPAYLQSPPKSVA